MVAVRKSENPTAHTCLTLMKKISEDKVQRDCCFVPTHQQCFYILQQSLRDCVEQAAGLWRDWC